MSTFAWIAIAAAVIVVAVIVLAAIFGRDRRRRLQDQFGPEYDRTVESADKRRDAERDLRDRVERHDALELHPLSDTARARYEQAWGELQTRFVDQPQIAVSAADGLVSSVMRDRGYPVDDFEEQSALVSVDHPRVVENYRRGHEIYVKAADGAASTEDLRVAVISYRDLFDELMRESADQRS
jgi:hypothetical protein